MNSRVLTVTYLNVENAETALNWLLEKQGTIIQVSYVFEKPEDNLTKEIVPTKNEPISKVTLKEEVKSVQKLNEVARYSTPFQSRQKTLTYTPIKKSVEKFAPNKM